MAIINRSLLSDSRWNQSICNRPIRILMADDNQSFLEAVWSCLYLCPVAKIIDQAHDGEEALVKARQLHPDLILLDIGMPKVSGLEVAKEINSWTNPPQIVILTMNDGEAYRAAAQEIGVFGFISKSEFVNELPGVLEKLLDHLNLDWRASS